jgi:hypothetical protein
MAETKSKGEGGSWLYGIILIIVGGFIATVGLLNLLGISILADLMALILVIGAWGVIGGIGLIKDQEWGWGISLVVLSAVIVTFLTNVITMFSGALFNDVILWIQFAAVVIAAIGIVYLLLTKYKYA